MLIEEEDVACVGAMQLCPWKILVAFFLTLQNPFWQDFGNMQVGFFVINFDRRFLAK